MKPFRHISLRDYEIDVKAIRNRDSKRVRLIRRYLTGMDVYILIKAEVKSIEANVALDYEWRLLRWNGNVYKPIKPTGWQGSGCLRGNLEVIKKKNIVAILDDKFIVEHIAPSGEYKLELKISRYGNVLTNPEWYSLGEIVVLNSGEVELKKELQKNAVIWAMIGIAIGTILTLAIPSIYHKLPEVTTFLHGILQWIWSLIRA